MLVDVVPRRSASVVALGCDLGSLGGLLSLLNGGLNGVGKLGTGNRLSVGGDSGLSDGSLSGHGTLDLGLGLGGLLGNVGGLGSLGLLSLAVVNVGNRRSGTRGGGSASGGGGRGELGELDDDLEDRLGADLLVDWRSALYPTRYSLMRSSTGWG